MAGVDAQEDECKEHRDVEDRGDQAHHQRLPADVVLVEDVRDAPHEVIVQWIGAFV